MAGFPDETLSRSACYKLLSLIFLPPGLGTAGGLGLISRVEPILRGLPAEHRAVLGPITAGNASIGNGPAEGEHERLFGPGRPVTPYGTEYDPLALARKGHRLADLLGFYSAFGFRLPEDRHELPDHIAIELEFMSLLLLKTAHARLRRMEDAEQISDEAARSFLDDHLAPWGLVFASRVEAAAEDGFYHFGARFLGAFLRAECALLGIAVTPPVMVPSGEMDLPGCAEACTVP